MLASRIVERSKPSARALLLWAAALTVVLWQFPPYGDLALYPFTLLATYAHEMGHGLSAMLLGARFESLVLYPDGSGVAAWTGQVGRVGRAMVAAGGLVGPSVAGAALLVLSRRPGRSRWLLAATGVAMLLAAVWVTGSLFSFAFSAGFGIFFLALARRGSERWTTFAVQLLGVQLCVALFRDVRYMFSPGGTVGGRFHGSDTAVMADALFLPYWVWGGLTATISACVLVLGLSLALRNPRSQPARSRSQPR